MRVLRAAIGMVLASASTLLGILAAMWLAGNVASAIEPLGSGWGAPLFLALGALMLLLGGIGLFVGYRIYFAVTSGPRGMG